MVKILHVDNSPSVTGAYKALLSWCLSAPEFEHVWVLPEGSSVVAEARRHFTVYTLPFAEIGKSPSKLLLYLPALWRNGKNLAAIIQKEQPAILHANDLYNLTPYAAKRMSGLNLPVVVHARMLRRSFPGPVYDWWKGIHLKRAARIIAVSEAIKRDWNDNSRVAVIYDPIIVSERLPEYTFQKAAGEPFRFLYLANYIQGKGQDDALKAIGLLHEQGIKNFTVDFYGGTMGLEKNAAYKKMLEETIAGKGLEQIVHIEDAVTDVEATMKQYDALLHFSHSESFGMVCYEGLYYGLPVISSDCGGPAEMIEPGTSGMLLPVGDVTGFAGAMRNFIQQPALCAAMSVAARRFVRHKFADAAALSRMFASVVAES